MNTTWYQYRDVWSAHPWVLGVAVLAVAMIVVGIVGTVLENLLLILFIPGLILLYGHHLIVQRKLG